MGQKIHPTGFRIGVSKAHDVNWFTNFGRFPKTLKEDQQIRQSWDKVAKKYFSLTFRAQITKIYIQRKKTFLQLKIYAGRPFFLLENNARIFTQLRNELNALNSTHCRFQVIKDYNGNTAAITTAKTIVVGLKKRLAYKRILKQVSTILHKESSITGFKIQVSGRLNGVPIARKYWVRNGVVPLQTLGANIDYTLQEAKTKYGIIGVKVWVSQSRH